MSEYKARKKDFQYDILELKLFFENGDAGCGKRAPSVEAEKVFSELPSRIARM